jgi:hypothetical protein
VSERNDEIVARLSVVEAQVARLRDDAAAESKLNLGFVQIKRTTDLIAFVAFILSALTLAAQLGEYTKSAELLSFFPSQIVIGNKEAMKRTRADDPVLFTATTQYVNRSLSGHNGIVQHEFFRIRIGDRNGQYHQVQYGPYQIVRTDVDDKNQLKVNLVQDSSLSPEYIVKLNERDRRTLFSQWWLAPECKKDD